MLTPDTRIDTLISAVVTSSVCGPTSCKSLATSSRATSRLSLPAGRPNSPKPTVGDGVEGALVLGLLDGIWVGAVGPLVGVTVGIFDGLEVACVGLVVGSRVGCLEGLAVGETVGDGVGRVGS